MTPFRPLTLRVGAFALAMIALLGLVHQTVTRPVPGAVDTFSALFTDANGLKPGDDVRVYGVRVGKVAGLELESTQARVDFTVQRGTELFDNTVLAIRYQNLTGQRFLDIQQPDSPEAALPAGTRIGVDRTVPSFDITTLFNGLQPVLATLSADELNRFATNLTAVIEGDGTRVGSALEAMRQLADHYVHDRQAVISTLVHNLGLIADRLGGRSGHAITLLTQLTSVFENLQQKSVGLVDYMLTIPPVIGPLRSLLDTLGLDQDPNPQLATLLRTAFPDPAQLTTALTQLPTVVQSLAAAVPTDPNRVAADCAHGDAEAPRPLSILLSGQRIILCKN